MKLLQEISSGLATLTVGCFFLLLLAMPATAAHNAGTDCSIASIDAKFNARYPKVEHSRHEERINSIQSLLKAAGYDPGKIDGWLGPDTDKALSQFCHAFKLDELVKQHNQKGDDNSTADLVTLTIEWLTKIANNAGKPNEIANGKEKPKEILLSGGGCGCSRDFYENSLVYGFFPYSLADGKKQVVDFSLFERIGYFALDLNEHGHITRKLHFPADAGSFPNIAGFINRAHKHRVKVDVTFAASSWQRWNVDQINNAVENMFSTVTREYEIAEPSWWRKRLPLVENNSTVHADGINLYFESYDESKDGKTLVNIVKELNQKLKQAEFDVKLNIMLGLNLADVDRRALKKEDQAQQEVGKEFQELAGEFHKLKNRFSALESILDSDPKTVDRVFIFLSEDTSQSKKDLRQIIEDTFGGEARRTVLRKMVPIVNAQGLGAQAVVDLKARVEKAVAQGEDVEAAKNGDSQFEDDLIYMQDNFAGIGLWHLPLTQKAETPEEEIAEKEAAQKEAAEIAAAEKEAEEKLAIATEAEGKVAAATQAAANPAEGKAAEVKAAEKTAAKTAEAAKAVARAAQMKVTELKAAAEKAAAEKAARQADVDTLRQALESKFQRDSKFAFLGEKFESYAVGMCEEACPNRWVFRIALDILLMLALIYWLWALGNCRLREFYQRQFLWFAGFGFITAMVFAVSAVCDPYWKGRAVYALVGIPLLILIGWGLSRLRRMNQPVLP